MQNGRRTQNSETRGGGGGGSDGEGFHRHGRRMDSVREFLYLGRTLASTDDDWPVVARNLQKAQATWGRLARILGR